MARPILASVCDDLTHEASSSSTMSARFCSGTEEQLLGHRHQNESHEGRAGQRTGRRNVTGNRKLRRIMSNATRLGAAAKSRNKVATCAPTVWLIHSAETQFRRPSRLAAYASSTRG